MDQIVAHYKRDLGSKAMGCAVYVVAAPFVALCLSLFVVAPVAYLLREEGGKDNRPGNVFVGIGFMGVLIVTSVGVIVWGLRDFRRRAGVEVAIHRDRVVVDAGRRRRVLAFDDVSAVRLAPAALDMECILEGKAGDSIRLPPDIAPFSIVQATLESFLIPGLVGRLDERLAAGDAIPVRDGRLRAVLGLFRGPGEIMVAILLFPRHPRRTPALIGHGIQRIRQGLLGMRGGFILEPRGACRSTGGDREPIPWDDLKLLRDDEVGLVLRSGSGVTLGASPFAENYWPAARWAASRIGPPRSGRGKLAR